MRSISVINTNLLISLLRFFKLSIRPYLLSSFRAQSRCILPSFVLPLRCFLLKTRLFHFSFRFLMYIFFFSTTSSSQIADMTHFSLPFLINLLFHDKHDHYDKQKLCTLSLRYPIYFFFHDKHDHNEEQKLFTLSLCFPTYISFHDKIIASVTSTN